MATGFLKSYFRIPLLIRIAVGFLTGTLLGIGFWIGAAWQGISLSGFIITWIAPFGAVLISMLKMIVIPVVFCSVVTGAASLSVRQFGGIGGKVLLWYLLTSFFAAMLGTGLALVVNPGSLTSITGWQDLIVGMTVQPTPPMVTPQMSRSLTDLLLGMFQNPFEALANNNFLGIIVFAILFGLGLRLLQEDSRTSALQISVQNLSDMFVAGREVIFKIVEWILEYSPVGVFALAVTNFGLYGKSIVGPYVSVTLGIIGGILGMIAIVYPLLLSLLTRQNPYHILKRMQEAVITAFITRSSAATLPVSLRTMQEQLNVRVDLTSFALPLGATINMDGVCVHLPMFAVLAANLFGVQLTATSLVILVITTVLASIGAGGVPGGSLMLLFIILEAIGLNSGQVAVIVALATGINPILDMFETANNVTGDMVCTYVVAHSEGMFEKDSAVIK